MNENPINEPTNTVEQIEPIMVEQTEADREPTIPAWDRGLSWLYKYPGKKTRAGFTTNKMQGQSKARRRMAKVSRRNNRVKA